MPDHFRAQVDAMGPPGSPTGSDSPLSLVMKKDGDLQRGRRHDELTLQLQGSPSRSSGFSEHEGPAFPAEGQTGSTHMHAIPLVHQDEEDADEEEEDAVPLSLVVAKHYPSDESGRGTAEDPQRPPTKLTIRDFARTVGPFAESDGDSDAPSDSMGSWDGEGPPSRISLPGTPRPFACRHCLKAFGRQSTLRAHLTTHTGTSNFMCGVCDKACNDNNALEEHLRMHTGEKPFACGVCGKAYARKSHLNVHYRVHTGERPFVCHDCGKDFTEKRFLNDHIQTAHNGQEGPLTCPNCCREFAYKTSLKQHLKKQMCLKNLNRGRGCPGQGTQAKQFACPFCDKSYSWKQTLKQHVSMYHRNKVHTDAFWKYELAKHRRAVLDAETNEDLWRRQLGKHAGAGRAETSTTHAALLREIDPHHEDKWLDQIKRAADAPPAADARHLALRSLGNATGQMQAGPDDPDIGEEGYLALLARVSYDRRRAERPALPDVAAPCWDRLGDIQEEPAAKRTQRWLAQLSRYRQRPGDAADLPREDLWEEQIARAGPVEICLDEDDDVQTEARPPPAVQCRPVPSVPLMVSALQVRPPPLTVTLCRGEGPCPSARPVPAFLAEENNNNNNTPPAQPLPPPVLLRSQPVPVPSVGQPSDVSFAHQSPPIGNDSVLKALLLDPASRKRPLSPPPQPPPRQTLPDDTDILRRRLMGLRDPIPTTRPKTPEPEPKAVPAIPTVPAAPASPPPRSHLVVPCLKDSYKKTSVLKHLLYRYCTTFEGSADNIKKDGL